MCETMKRRSFLIRAVALAGLGGAAWWARDNVLWRGPQIAFAAGGTSGELPWAQPRAGVPTATVSLMGREVTALIDSGAQYSVIDRALVAELGIDGGVDMPMVAYGVSGEPQVGRGVTLEVTIGDMTLSGLRAAILDLGPLASPQGLGAPLILGQDVLGAAVLDLDVAERRLALTRREDHVLDPALASLPVRRSGRMLMLDVTVEGAVIPAVVDTGASALLALSRESATAAGLLDGRPSRQGQSIVLGGVVGAEVVQARTVTVGDTLFRNQATAIYADVPLPGFPAALLGMEAFAGQRLTLDVGGARLFASRPLDLTIS